MNSQKLGYFWKLKINFFILFVAKTTSGKFYRKCSAGRFYIRQNNIWIFKKTKILDFMASFEYQNLNFWSHVTYSRYSYKHNKTLDKLCNEIKFLKSKLSVEKNTDNSNFQLASLPGRY